ncbi:MAG: acetyl-CoA carboxylase biotin carboxylase subunit family protein [Frankiaceae bacterium]
MKKILLLHARGGAALEHALPRMAQHGELHVLAVQPMPTVTEALWRPACRSVTDISDERLSGPALVDRVVQEAEALRADAVLTLSEHLVLVAAAATTCLGLRGAGSGAVRARDKRLMRETWRTAGVPIPAFASVGSPEELLGVVRELSPPLLLKSAWGAGSLGHLVIESERDARAAWSRCQEALARAAAAFPLEYLHPDASLDMLVEEMLEGDIDSWLPGSSGHADYLSVEGLVLDGTYHPLCIMARLPTIPPFTELGILAPCLLPDHLQKVVEEASREAVDALGLDTCATHAELKLTADEGVVPIEVAARFGGMMILRQIEEVFGLDPVALLLQHLLGVPGRPPDRMLMTADARAAAASVVLIGADARGRPWKDDDLVWDASAVDWARLVSPASEVMPVPGLTVPNGSTFPRYRSTDGSRSAAGIAFLRSPDPDTLVRDAHGVIDGLESAVRAAQGR